MKSICFSELLCLFVSLVLLLLNSCTYDTVVGPCRLHDNVYFIASVPKNRPQNTHGTIKNVLIFLGMSRFKLLLLLVRQLE